MEEGGGTEAGNQKLDTLDKDSVLLRGMFVSATTSTVELHDDFQSLAVIDITAEEISAKAKFCYHIKVYKTTNKTS
ncbi:hypothetical protein TrispH2_012004 [Trichoplax sp. H2]|nr:hypothetical protein TrispH2_012004 [Trichoplax sp. H2]|eukprot:RDD35793.1 hypothetical protein TrispH2_012004 [Trichoplax sp. H2]